MKPSGPHTYIEQSPGPAGRIIRTLRWSWAAWVQGRVFRRLSTNTRLPSLVGAALSISAFLSGYFLDGREFATRHEFVMNCLASVVGFGATLAVGAPLLTALSSRRERQLWAPQTEALREHLGDVLAALRKFPYPVPTPSDAESFNRVWHRTPTLSIPRPIRRMRERKSSVQLERDLGIRPPPPSPPEVTARADYARVLSKVRWGVTRQDVRHARNYLALSAQNPRGDEDFVDWLAGFQIPGHVESSPWGLDPWLSQQYSALDDRQLRQEAAKALTAFGECSEQLTTWDWRLVATSTHPEIRGLGMTFAALIPQLAEASRSFIRRYENESHPALRREATIKLHRLLVSAAAITAQA